MLFILTILWLGTWSRRNTLWGDLRLISLFRYLTSFGRLDGVSFPKIRPGFPSAHAVDVWNSHSVVIGGTLSAPTLIALHGEVRDYRRRVQPPVSVVSFTLVIYRGSE